MERVDEEEPEQVTPEEQEQEQEPEKPEEKEEEVVDERPEIEEHEQYQESEQDEGAEEVCFYDPNDVREIEVNSKNKATSLKKIILESIGLFKRANIVLLKSAQHDNPEKAARGEINWVPFSDQDYETQVKYL